MKNIFSAIFFLLSIISFTQPPTFTGKNDSKMYQTDKDGNITNSKNCRTVSEFSSTNCECIFI